MALSSGDFELDQLPKELFWGRIDLYQFEGYWYGPGVIDSILEIHSHFQPRADDVMLASSMKTGTTWLKALCHCITAAEEEDLLLHKNPHSCVPTLETRVYEGSSSSIEPDLTLTDMPSPRLFHTHLPYSILPPSIKSSDCKIVYITRNPKDILVSLWHFYNKIMRPNEPPYPLEKAVEFFCNGVHAFGPFHKHVVGYWKESKRMPQRVLFLRYEELIRDPRDQVKRLGLFLGRSMLDDDEVDKILHRCSLERLKGLEINKSGKRYSFGLPNSAFFRDGVVGDWKNHLTPQMADRIDELTGMEFEGTGLDLDLEA